MKFAPPKVLENRYYQIKKKKLDQKLKMTILLSLDFERNTRFESDDLTNVTQIIYMVFTNMNIYVY